MSFLENLYQEVILDHYKRPRNHRVPEPHSHHEEGLNPSCGDELELYLYVDDGVVVDAGFTGQGCAISQASASMLTEAVRGTTVAEALELSRAFKAMIHGEPPDEALGDLKALQGVSKLHARVKCATLAWVTLEQALAGDGIGPDGAEPDGAESD